MVPHDSTEVPDAERDTIPQEPKCLKVAFIGSHGVGKTTLCFELAARLKRLDYRVDMVKEVARRCPLPINKETTLEAQAWILHNQIAVEIETAWMHDVIICDRSVLDNYAYMVDACGRRGAYDALVSHWLSTYDTLIWVPILEGPHFDGVRDTDRMYQRRIDEKLEELVDVFGVSARRLHDLKRDDWIEATMEALPLGVLQLPLFEEDSL